MRRGRSPTNSYYTLLYRFGKPPPFRIQIIQQQHQVAWFSTISNSNSSINRTGFSNSINSSINSSNSNSNSSNSIRVKTRTSIYWEKVVKLVKLVVMLVSSIENFNRAGGFQSKNPN